MLTSHHSTSPFPTLPSHLSTKKAEASSTGAGSSASGKPGSSGAKANFALDSWVVAGSGACFIGGLAFGFGV